MEHLLLGGSGPVCFACVCISMVCLVIPDPETLAAGFKQKEQQWAVAAFVPLAGLS